MSFLLRRNLPRAWAGFYDTFDDYGSGEPIPLQWPWFHVGDGEVGWFTDAEEMVICGNFLSTNAGGPGYPYMPFTSDWGYEYEMSWPVSGLATQSFTLYQSAAWAQVNSASFAKVVGVRLMQAPALGGISVRVDEFDNVWTPANNLAKWPVPESLFTAWMGTVIRVRVYIDQDKYIRVWLNDMYLGTAIISPSYQPGPRRRASRFLNASLANAFIRQFRCYDRVSDFPSAGLAWFAQFTDNFNRANGPVANGWTEIGANAQHRIISNSYGWVTGTDGSRAILRNSGRVDGRMRVEGIVGGSGNPSSRPQSLVVRSNAAGTSALVANVLNNTVSLGVVSTSMSDNSPTITLLGEAKMTIAAGDRIALAVRDNWAWIEVNGNEVFRWFNIDALVPTSQAYYGLRLSRSSFTNSGSWNDFWGMIPV